MAERIFTGSCISFTLKNLRRIVSTFPLCAGSVSVVSPNRIQTQISRWRSLLPRVTPYYAVKSNPDPTLLQILADNNAGFDCASLRELHEVRKLGWPSDDGPSDVVYAHPMKSARDIGAAGSMNIRTTVVDSIEECDKLSVCGWKGDAFLRVAVGDSGSKMPFSTKFGASKNDVENIAKCSTIPLSGVSFHVGSGCHDFIQYVQAIQYASGPVFDILRKYGHQPTTLDIGGGFSAVYRDFSSAANAINTGLDGVPKNRRIIAEPGRYFAQPCQDLFVKVIGKKRGVNGKGWRYFIDESLYGHFSCIPFDHQRPAWLRIPQDPESYNSPLEESIMFGRTCDSLDVISKGMMEQMEVGDWLYFPLMGAYTSATASEFNGFPKPYSVLDTESLLPNIDDAADLVSDIHKLKPLTYSNALPPII